MIGLWAIILLTATFFNVVVIVVIVYDDDVTARSTNTRSKWYQCYYCQVTFDVGYDHGCNDASISDFSNRYINQPEKGPSFHTDEFMLGYDAGYNACSDVINKK